MEPLYDKVALRYDEFYQDPLSEVENERVGAALLKPIRNYRPRILDMGCGTGALFDIIGSLRHEMRSYTGVDVSQGMIDQFVKKYPNYAENLEVSPIEEVGVSDYDLYVSLFGSPSYFTDDFLAKLSERLRYGGHYLLMFYKQGYKSRVLGEYDYQYADPTKHFDNLIEFSNYRVASNIWES